MDERRSLSAVALSTYPVLNLDFGADQMFNQIFGTKHDVQVCFALFRLKASNALTCCTKCRCNLLAVWKLFLETVCHQRPHEDMPTVMCHVLALSLFQPTSLCYLR